jgi:transposase InsO family protein
MPKTRPACTSVVLDAWSRRVVGWGMATHLRTELVLDALNMAIGQRRPTAVIRHSDQCCQYTSLAFERRCEAAGVRPSIGSVGDAYDNALCESFFATLECELPTGAASPPRSRRGWLFSSTSKAGQSPPSPLRPRLRVPDQL